MRRGLLTVGAPPAVIPVDVGFDFTSASSSGTVFSGRMHWSDANPLNAGGTITSIQADLNFTGSVAFALITPGNVIRSISDNMSATSGVANYSVNLTGEAGDYIGVWGNSNFFPRYTTVSGVTHFRSTLTSGKPVPNEERAPSFTTSNRAVWIYGTG